MYWADPSDKLFADLQSSPDGLSAGEALRRLQTVGPNRIRTRQKLTWMRVLGRQLKNPLLLILLVAAIASTASREWVDAMVVSVIVAATVVIGFWREYSAEVAAAALQARVRTTCRVVRDGQILHVPAEDLVPGDVVVVGAGTLIPADGRIIDGADLFVNEAVLTGESFPSPKAAGTVSADASLSHRTNCAFLGTNVRSGTGRMVVVHTGIATEFGHIAGQLAADPPETEFERGLRQFGYFLTSATIALLLLIVSVNILASRPPLETLLFAIALAVGLSPELLPAILTVNLSRGAEALARQGVLVRRLNAIENLGSIDVLCTDKTGTLTEGIVKLDNAYDASGTPSAAVLTRAAVNAGFHTGLENPLDTAITEACPPEGLKEFTKVAEIPFDFVRKRISVVVSSRDGTRLITKGAFHSVLEVCRTLPDGRAIDAGVETDLEQRYDAWSRAGIRVVAIAERVLQADEPIDRGAEHDLMFLGFITFLDRPKADAGRAVQDLARLGVAIKVISGDSDAVVRHVASLVGLGTERVLTGQQLDTMSDEALWNAAGRTTLFSEVNPNQKERIIRALRRTNHVVGFLGDGVNDAPAMHAADTSLSVEGAVDVARATADFVLLERDLDVIRRGIEEGRRTFQNTMKYLLTTMSANLGNMISMAIASVALPFLPLLPGQILLNNFLSDLPAAGIAGDAVDPEQVASAHRWNIRFLARFMILFGGLSSIFDFATFGLLIFGFSASPGVFRTGWFVESLLTELLVALVIRTRRPFWRSRPGTLLLGITCALVPLTLAAPFLPGSAWFGFEPLPFAVLLSIVGITAAYVAAAEAAKRWLGPA